MNAEQETQQIQKTKSEPLDNEVLFKAFAENNVFFVMCTNCGIQLDLGSVGVNDDGFNKALYKCMGCDTAIIFYMKDLKSI